MKLILYYPKGKNLLEKMIGSEVFTFIPPCNTYDLNTLRVLEALNFSTISVGIRMGASNNSKLNFMPMTIRLHQIHDAVIRERASLDKQPLIVVMFQCKLLHIGDHYTYIYSVILQ